MTITEKWTILRQRREAGLIAYTMAGFPTLERSHGGRPNTRRTRR